MAPLRHEAHASGTCCGPQVSGKGHNFRRVRVGFAGRARLLRPSGSERRSLSSSGRRASPKSVVRPFRVGGALLVLGVFLTW